MEVKHIYDSHFIRNKKINNRICMPPMVCYHFSKHNNSVVERHVEHYRARAKGGVGLIIQEATAISSEGLLATSQLGIWNDRQMEGHARIAKAVHDEGGVIIMQIHHAGIKSISGERLSPSPYCLKVGDVIYTGREMTKTEIHKIEGEFISSAIRAHNSGYDGIELHGCHSYIISAFLNRQVNNRKDEYGRDEMKFVAEILQGIRDVVPKTFIIGIRLGGFEPNLAASIRHAQELEKLGIDFIDVSYGFSSEMETEKPKDFPFTECVFAAQEIKKAVSLPVFAANGIHTPEQARLVLTQCNVDMVDIGRSLLVDPDWANKAIHGEQPGQCLDCKVCQCRIDDKKCAGRILLNKRQ